MNTIKTFNASGKCMHTEHFCNADESYKEYKEIIKNLLVHLPCGYLCTVVRYKDDKIMAMQTVTGTKEKL